MEQIFTNTLTSGLGNQFATVIGHGGVNELGIHDGSPLFGNAFATALAHGITQGAMSALRGQKFKSGFISGIVSKFSEGIFDSQALKDADAFTKASISPRSQRPRPLVPNVPVGNAYLGNWGQQMKINQFYYIQN